jgi:hypothetical protein
VKAQSYASVTHEAIIKMTDPVNRCNCFHRFSEISVSYVNKAVDVLVLYFGVAVV